MTSLKVGTLLENGKYRIEKVIGQGGFGMTYLGEQVNLGRKVAIKEFYMKEYCNRDEGNSKIYTLSQGSSELVERFRVKFVKEARSLARLRHPNIVSIIDIFEENDTAYYVMEFHAGGSLAEKVKNAPLPEADAVKYIRQIAFALEYVHSKQMMHLDVKPANILLDGEGNAILIDFGLAKQYDNDGRQTSTTPIGISHGYAPMEQYKNGGVSEFSPVSDIYSLGATLYKLVTGLTPPEANDVFEAGLPDLPATLSPQVCAAIEKSMQPRRASRPQNIGEFLSLLSEKLVHSKDVADEEIVSVAPAAKVQPSVPLSEETALGTPADEETRFDGDTPRKESASLKDEPYVAPKPDPNKVDDAQRSAEIKKVMQQKKTKSGCGGAIVKIFVTLLVLAGLAVGGYFVWKYFINDELSLEEKMALMDKYDQMLHFDENGLAMVSKKNGEYDHKYGYIDKKGREVVTCKYERVGQFYEGLCRVAIEQGSSNRRCGFVDTNGNEVIPCQFENAEDFSDGMAAVRKGDKWGYIGKGGNLIIDYQFKSASNFHNGRALVANEGEIYFIDKYGNQVLYVDSYNERGEYSWVNIHDAAGYFHYAKYEDDDRHERIIDSNGYELPFAYKYDRVWFLDYKTKESRVNLVFGAERGNRFALVDVYGNEVVPMGKYDNYDGDIAFGFEVGNNGKTGFLNFNGNEIIPCEYDYAWMISENMAFVEQNGKYGLVNANNKIVVPIEYNREDIHPYIGIEMIKVTSGGNTLYYDFEGNQVQR